MARYVVGFPASARMRETWLFRDADGGYRRVGPPLTGVTRFDVREEAEAALLRFQARFPKGGAIAGGSVLTEADALRREADGQEQPGVAAELRAWADALDELGR